MARASASASASASDSASAPDTPLIGLALAGGHSRRMRRDKGGLDFHGRPQVEHCLGLLGPLCESAWVSVRAAQATHSTYRHLPLIVDDEEGGGPAAGLIAAWKRFPDHALMVLAVDMPFVDASLLRALAGRRDSSRLATAFCHSDGMIEPLCAIWEPAAAARLVARTGSRAPSLRRILAENDVLLLRDPAAEQLASVNTPEALDSARGALGKKT